MQINQVYSLLNDINQQMWGEDALAVNDLSGIISMGQSVLSSSTNVDKFFNTLIDRIGKVIIRRLDLELDFPKLMMNEFEFGAILQKITIDPFGAKANTDWQITDPGFTPSLLEIYPPSIHQMLFTDAVTFEMRKSLPNSILSTAFTGAGEMANFMTAVTAALVDSMTLSINNLSRTCINNFIAEKIKNNNGVVNLADMYNAAYSSSPVSDVDEAMHNPEFLRYATNVIRKYFKYLSMPNVNYNVGGLVRATQRDNMHFLANTSFVAGLESYLYADTFHDEMVSLNNFTEVAYWQGDLNSDNTSINLPEDVTAINVIPSSEKGQTTPTAVDQSGIIAVLADRQAIGVGLNKRRSAAFNNVMDDYTTVKMSATIQYYNDLTENGIIFLAEPTPGP